MAGNRVTSRKPEIDSADTSDLLSKGCSYLLMEKTQIWFVPFFQCPIGTRP